MNDGNLILTLIAKYLELLKNTFLTTVKKMKRKTIAILGVDGAGKSTVIENLKQLLKDKCFVQYMGSRSYEDPKLVELLGKTSMTKVEVLYSIWLRYRCFWKRYNKAVATGKIVLFDRSVDEIYINSSGLFKILYTVLYKYMFPTYSSVIYLHCSAEESLRRKNDIPNAEVFRAMKGRFDKYFLNNPKCLCLSSEEHSPQELTELAYNYIMERYGHE